MVDMELHCFNISKLIQSITVQLVARDVRFSLRSSCTGYVRSPESKVQLPTSEDLRKEMLPEHDGGSQADLRVLRNLTDPWEGKGEAGRRWPDVAANATAAGWLGTPRSAAQSQCCKHEGLFQPQ